MTEKLSSAFMKHCGIKVISLELGKSELRMVVNENLLNRANNAHGGVLASLADCAGAVAAWQTIEEGEALVTTDFNITCLKSTCLGDTLIAKGRLIHRGKKFIRSEVEILLESDEKNRVAKAGISFLVVPKRNV